MEEEKFSMVSVASCQFPGCAVLSGLEEPFCIEHLTMLNEETRIRLKALQNQGGEDAEAAFGALFEQCLAQMAAFESTILSPVQGYDYGEIRNWNAICQDLSTMFFTSLKNPISGADKVNAQLRGLLGKLDREEVEVLFVLFMNLRYIVAYGQLQQRIALAEGAGKP